MERADGVDRIAEGAVSGIDLAARLDDAHDLARSRQAGGIKRRDGRGVGLNHPACGEIAVFVLGKFIDEVDARDAAQRTELIGGQRHNGERISARVLDAKHLRPCERSEPSAHHARIRARLERHNERQFSGVAQPLTRGVGEVACRPACKPRGDLPLRFEIRQATDKPEPLERLRVDGRARDKK